jgi:hypothetical protein
MTAQRNGTMTERLLDRFVSLVLRRRLLTAGLVLGITVFLAIQATSVEMYSQFRDLLPQHHPYIQAHTHYKETFGDAANVLTLVIQVTAGDIFTPKTLLKVRYLTEQLDLIDGVDHTTVSSIAHTRVRKVEPRPGGFIRSEPVMAYEIPTDPSVLERLRHEIFNNSLVYNQYVSADGKAALLWAGFSENRLDYRLIYREIVRLKAEIEDENTTLLVAGEPMLKGWVGHFAGEWPRILGVTLVLMLLALLLYFRRLSGVLIPFVGAIIQGVWGLGFIGLLGLHLDPLILVIPLLISARAVSHAVQLTERYFEEFAATKDQQRAVERTMRELFLPGLISIISDAGGLLVLAVATIPLIRTLAVFGSFWAFSNLFAVLLLTPMLLSVLPAPRRTDHYVPQWMVQLLNRIGRLVTEQPWRGLIVTAGISILLGGWFATRRVPIGEQEAGSSLLWPDAHYNVSARGINERFMGANRLVIYLEGERPHVLKEPRVLTTIEDFGRYLQEQPAAGGVRDLPSLIRRLNRLYHYDDPRWEVIPPSVVWVGNFLAQYECACIGVQVQPLITSHINLTHTAGQIEIFYKDTRASTLREAIARAKKYIAEHPLEGVRFRLAGGIVGAMAALNEEIAASERRSTLLITLAVFILVTVSYGSLVAGGLVVLTMLAAGVASYLYMLVMGIGLNINSLPVAAVGMGIGVDYILYMVDRIRREAQRTGDVDQGIRQALATSGMAVTFTATTMMLGVVPWFVLSSLRFSAEMAVLLAVLLFTHWLAALTLAPSLCAVWRPHFVLKETGPVPAGLQPEVRAEVAP